MDPWQFVRWISAEFRWPNRLCFFVGVDLMLMSAYFPYCCKSLLPYSRVCVYCHVHENYFNRDAKTGARTHLYSIWNVSTDNGSKHTMAYQWIWSVSKIVKFYDVKKFHLSLSCLILFAICSYIIPSCQVVNCILTSTCSLLQFTSAHNKSMERVNIVFWFYYK